MHTYIFIYRKRERERTKSFAVYLKITQYCKLTIVQFKKNKFKCKMETLIKVELW